MNSRIRILLKLTGNIFLDPATKKLSPTMVNAVIAQLKTLHPRYQFGIVVGGGNFFRGKDQGTTLGMTQAVGHQVGMLATMMNGLILKDLLEQQGLATTLFCAVQSAEVGNPISQQTINTALEKGNTLIFSGGTGNPFFTTDTNAILRSLQISAAQVWKGTDVDGIYEADPHAHANAPLLKKVSYAQALEQRLAIMDATAYALASQYRQTVRIFNIFAPQALLKAANDETFGSTLY